MASPFLGEIKIVGFNFPPKGWALCTGQLLPIQQNQALFSLFGTMYGGNGVQTFGLPNLQGRSALHVGPGYTQGQMSGEAAHTLTPQEIPPHSHPAYGSTNNPSAGGPGNALWCNNATQQAFSTHTLTGTMNTGSITNNGGSQPHDNMSPYLALYFVVALQGIFPTRS